METILTVKEKTIYYLEVEKSKFYALAFPIKTENDVNKFLDETIKEYPKARHYCYAYILDKEEKYSDDGEPQGTAGRAILGQLEVNNLKFTLVIVVRYFGGTLLGSGRLLRTYLTSAKEVIAVAKKQQLLKMKKWRVQVEIDTYQNFLSFLNKQCFVILKQLFNDKITIDFLTPYDFKENLKSMFYGKIDIIGQIDYLYGKDV